MTDTHLWIDAEGGPYLPEAVTLIATASGRGDDPDGAIDKLHEDIATCWPGWRMSNDEIRIRRFTVHAESVQYEATAKITKEVTR